MKLRMKGLCLTLVLFTLTSTALASYRTLRPGENSDEVLRMQQALAFLQYPIKADGKYGDGTQQTVMAFQASRNLTSDGLAGNKTLTALFQLAPQFDYKNTASAPLSSGQSATKASTIPQGTYRMGDEAQGVRLMQQRLMALNYPLTKADAVYGRGTKEAVALFQQANGLKADGIAGQSTLDRLFSSWANAYTPQATSAPAATFAPVATTLPVAPVLPQQPVTQGVSPIQGTYRLGDEAQGVRTLQQRLMVLNYPITKADAVYGRLTREAVMLFQKNNGLKADGVAGPGTLNRLFSASAQPSGAAATTAPVPNQPVQTAQPLPLPLGQAKVATQNRGSLNLRSTPQSLNNRNVVRTLPFGADVQLLEKNNSWCRISYQGTSGYVMTKFLSFPQVQPVATPVPSPSAPVGPETPVQEARTLRLTMQGEDVLKVQKRLKELKYAAPENSQYDAATRDAVAKFQALNGLAADGICGAQTQNMLFSPAAKAAGSTPTSFTTLKIDNKDSGGKTNIALLQSRLKELGYPLKVSGTYDVSTHQAVVGFQQRNGLTISGIANPSMQQVLYSGAAKGYDAPADSLPADAGKGGGVSSGSVKLLHWYKDIRPSIRGGQTAKIYHPASGISFTIRFYSLGAHADSEPLTWRDTQLMNKAFGAPSWNVNTVYVQLPSGTWTLAAMHNRPHLSGGITDNGFGGHLCIHFLRDMEETQRNDPNYGVTNQKAIRNAWKNMTGETITN